jgi:hypothetical protein
MKGKVGGPSWAAVLGWSGPTQKGEGKIAVHGLEARGLRRTLVGELWPESVVSF